MVINTIDGLMKRHHLTVKHGDHLYSVPQIKCGGTGARLTNSSAGLEATTRLVERIPSTRTIAPILLLPMVMNPRIAAQTPMANIILDSGMAFCEAGRGHIHQPVAPK